jgi:hypothetical protein
VVPSAEVTSAEPTGSLTPESLKIDHAEPGNACAKDPANAPEIAAAGPSAADRFKTGAKAGWASVKQNSKIAALHAQIEKLRNVDLRRAHHALGKRCYELGLLEDPLASSFAAIREIEASIAKKQEKVEAAADETRMAALKRIGKDTAKATHAQGLALKREHLITELGKQAYIWKESGALEGLASDIETVENIHGQIQVKEAEAKELRGNGKGRVPMAALLVLAILVGGVVVFSVRNAYCEAAAAKLVEEANSLAFRASANQDWNKAVSLLQEAVDLGSHEAEYKLGSCYLFGRGVSQDTGKAVNLFRNSAEGGFAEAQFNLSVCYAKGDGVERSEEIMLKWLRKSADQKCPQALHCLGLFYLDGKAVPEDRQKGIELITSAANQGYAQAQYQLSMCFEMGDGVSKDLVQACKWAILATRSGLSGGEDALRELKGQINAKQIETAERLAHEWTPGSTGAPH